AAEQPPSHPSAAASSASQSQPASICEPAILGSPYIPVDSWVYPAVYRLFSLGYLNHVYLGMRPWTRASLSHMLEDAEANIEDAEDSPETEQAKQIYGALMHELAPDTQGPCGALEGQARIESAYTVFRGIGGTPLDDSFHLGQTIINDYGRPIENGFNSYSGISGYATAGRFTLYARGEFQHAPSAAGYSAALASTLSCVVDQINVSTTPNQTCVPYYPQATIPLGPIASQNNGRLLEAYVSFQLLNHVFSFGKQDQWLGPAKGASFAYSNNAQNIYGFEINRIEPVYVPGLSHITGPFRYEFLIGPLGGHTLVPNPLYTGDPATQPNVITPGNPWMHLEKVSFKPTDNIEFGFERTALFGGKGHEPVTLHSFLRSFFSLTATNQTKKDGNTDPGARFGSWDFSYRLPYVRNWLTLYADGEVHDDISPIDAPRRASWRPGLYLSHVPGLPRLSLRSEVAWTDPPVSTSNGGRFMYWEYMEKQGYTNQGQIFGDWVGREDKGGQAWATWHLSGDEWIQASWRHQKAAKDFIPGPGTTQTKFVPGGTTLNDLNVQVVKRIGQNFAIDGNF
ncbi:MAG TPA: capsule assembly Wzi family protein, partial [Terriglobia bacterium]|nr:capsule assembly Wzi family protein [Terriglobia bacterium]